MGHRPLISMLAYAGFALLLPLSVQAQEQSQLKAPIVVIMSDMERLLATEQIRLLKGRYFTATDGKDWQALRGVFTPDAKVTVGIKRPDGSAADTVDEFVQVVSTMLADMGTRHHGHNLRVTFITATEADGVWDSETWTWPLAGAKSTAPGQHRLGQYAEHYVKTSDGWRIASMISTPVHAFPTK